MKWLLAHPNCPERVVIVGAHLVAPYSYQIKNQDSNVWFRTFGHLEKCGNLHEANYFAALLLALSPSEGTSRRAISRRRKF